MKRTRADDEYNRLESNEDVGVIDHIDEMSATDFLFENYRIGTMEAPLSAREHDYFSSSRRKPQFSLKELKEKFENLSSDDSLPTLCLSLQLLLIFSSRVINQVIKTR